jgi:cytochrome c-type biogenesis protein CcmH/NrfF/tetratricopeptide (TPR) repeat protein
MVGSGVFSSTPPTAAQRAAAIESVIRCPSCEDLSVAVSSAPTAVTVRATVARMIAQGQSDQQVEDYLVARYGSAIVLDPPTSGWSALVWALPVVVGVLGATGLVVVLARRRRGDRDLDADVRGGSVDPAVLAERRRFLTRSLADADAEYLAGDLSDADYLALRHRDLARLAVLGPAPVAVGAQPEDGTASRGVFPATAIGTLPDLANTVGAAAAAGTTTPTGSAPVPIPAAARRSGRNKWFLAAAAGCFGVSLVVAVPLFASSRLPGQTATGSVNLSPSQQLARSLDQAATVENQGQLGLAAQLYQSILASHADNEVALAQLGWLEYRIGRAGSSATLVADARTRLNQAASLAPGDYAVHLYLGTILLQQDGNAAGAVDQFRMFLAADPPATVVRQAASTLRAGFVQAGRSVPAGVPAG